MVLTTTVTASLRTFFALWFISQIVLPFTAPLQTCDLRDLLSGHNHSAQTPHESSAVPTAEDASASAVLVWHLGPLGLCETERDLAVRRRAAAVFESVDLPTSPQVRQTVLRL
jgi:hypothetical protein